MATFAFGASVAGPCCAITFDRGPGSTRQRTGATAGLADERTDGVAEEAMTGGTIEDEPAETFTEGLTDGLIDGLRAELRDGLAIRVLD